MLAHPDSSSGKSATTGLSPHLEKQLKLESERIYTLLKDADAQSLEYTQEIQQLRSQLDHSLDKLQKANSIISRLSSENVKLREDTVKYKHQLELCSRAIQRSSESHAGRAQERKTQWDLEKQDLLNQIEGLKVKLEDNTSREWRLWARDSFSLPADEVHQNDDFHHTAHNSTQESKDIPSELIDKGTKDGPYISEDHIVRNRSPPRPVGNQTQFQEQPKQLSVEEEEGASIILNNLLIRSPDFDYFDARSLGSEINYGSSPDPSLRPTGSPSVLGKSLDASTNSEPFIVPPLVNTLAVESNKSSFGDPNTNLVLAGSRPSSYQNENKETSTSSSTERGAADPLVPLLLGSEMTLVSTILSAVPPRSKTLLLNPLMRLFAAHGKVARLLQWGIDLEVAGTQSSASLFRSDSISSRALSAFTKSVGRDYLEQILSPTLRIITDNADSVNRYEVSTFEVDQEKINRYGGRGGEAQANLRKLIAQVDCVIESVKQAEPLLPESFRHVCNYLYNKVNERFQDVNVTAGHCAVGSLLFLRFICPALTVPESFGIQIPRSKVLDAVPAASGHSRFNLPGLTKAERRSTVLITKLVQKVVSGIPYSSQADLDMFPCNSFILQKRDEVRQMLFKICSITHNSSLKDVKDDAKGGVTFPDMEKVVARDLARVQDQNDLQVGEAMRTVRSLLIQDFRRIDSEIPPVAFVLQNKFREALNMPRSRKGSRNRSTSDSSNGAQGSNYGGDKRGRFLSKPSSQLVGSKKKREKQKKKKKKKKATKKDPHKSKEIVRGHAQNSNTPSLRRHNSSARKAAPKKTDSWHKDQLIGFLARDMGL